MTFDTILESLKKYKKIIPEEYHYVVALTNLSITEFLKLQEIYQPYSSMRDPSKLFHNLGGIITDELKKNGINTDNIPDIQSKISLLGQAILKLKNKKIGKDSILVPDSLSVFIIIYYLILNKSFWMLFSEKNHGFLTYIIERCFEFTDQYLNEHIYHSYDKVNDTVNIRKNKAKIEEAKKNKKDTIKFTNKELMSDILNNYFNYPQTPNKPTEQHVLTNLQLNNLDPSGENIIKIDEKSIINDDDQEVVYKLQPNSQYINDNSLAQKFNKVPQDKIDHIFSFYINDNDMQKDIQNLAILLLSTGSKGLIQYLFISGLYVIFKNATNSIEDRIQSRKGKKVDFKTRHIIIEKQFHMYLKNRRVFEDRVFVQELSSILKINIHKQVNDYYSGTGSIYEKFLKYIWEEYKTVSTFKKIFT